MMENALLALFFGGLSNVVDELRMDEAFNELFNQFFILVTQPMTFPWAENAQLYFQAIALGIVVLVLIVKAITGGIIGNGSSGGGEGFFGFVFRNLWPVAVVAFIPLIISTVTDLSARIIFDLAAHSELNYFSSFLDGPMMGYFFSWSEGSPVGRIIFFILVIVSLFYTISVILQCVKRQFQLCFLSIVAPLIAAVTISENNAGDFVTIMKEIIGIGVITALQILALESCYSIAISSVAITDTFGIMAPFVIMAAFSAIKRLPQWIERYTLAPSVSGGSSALGRMGGIAVGAGARSAISSVVK